MNELQRDPEAEKLVTDNFKRAAKLLAAAESLILAALARRPGIAVLSEIRDGKSLYRVEGHDERQELLAALPTLERLTAGLDRFGAAGVCVLPAAE